MIIYCTVSSSGKVLGYGTGRTNNDMVEVEVDKGLDFEYFDYYYNASTRTLDRVRVTSESSLDTIDE